MSGTSAENRQLTEEEIKQVRELLTASSRQKWALAAIAGASRWIVIVIGAWLALKGFASEALTWQK